MSYSIEWLKYGFICRFSGNISIQSILECDAEIFMDNRFSTIHFGVYDFQNANLLGVKREDLLKVASVDSQKSHAKRSFRFAIVATDHAAENVSECYRYLAELTGSEWQTRVFNDSKMALDWCQKCEQA